LPFAVALQVSWPQVLDVVAAALGAGDDVINAEPERRAPGGLHIYGLSA
jgi:hypothetical protein